MTPAAMPAAAMTVAYAAGRQPAQLHLYHAVAPAMAGHNGGPPLYIRPDELIIDNFAGGGGASTGIETALGRSPDFAINHDPEALAMHAVNHPLTRHLCEDIWDVKPIRLVRRADGSLAPIALVWLSPDCKHFSKAKGGKPVSKRVRGLAWIAMRYAALPLPARPRVIMLENVEEFTTWGPLITLPDGTQRPNTDRRWRGYTFRSFIRQLRRKGYSVEWQERRACNAGAPTIRKRLFLIARRDGVAPQWAPPSHGKPGSADVLASRLKPWRTAAQCIDWSIPCPSIFLTPEEAKRLKVKRPLATPTQARIARGLDRFVLRAAKPFIIPVTHQPKHGPLDGRSHSIDEPVRTLTTANRGELALVSPTLTRTAHGDIDRHGKRRGRGEHDIAEPLPSILASGDVALTAATLVGCGGRAGQSRPRGLNEPLHTTTAKADTCITTAHLLPYYGERRPGEDRSHSLDDPLRTQTTENRFALVTGSIIKMRGDSAGADLQDPLPTITAGPKDNPAGAAHAMGLQAVYLAQHNAGPRNEKISGHPVDAPVSTITSAGSQQNLAAASLVQLRGSNRRGQSIEDPAPTIAAQGQHEAISLAYLTKYYGEGGQDQPIDEPLHTATAKARFGISQAEAQQQSGLTDDQRYAAWWIARWFETFVPSPAAAIHPALPGIAAPRRTMLSVEITEERAQAIAATCGTAYSPGAYAIVDIGMRMLVPRELYRAQGFPEHYVINIQVERLRHGKRVWVPLPIDAQNRMVGNSVSPLEVEALVRTNFSIRPPDWDFPDPSPSPPRSSSRHPRPFPAAAAASQQHAA